MGRRPGSEPSEELITERLELDPADLEELRELHERQQTVAAPSTGRIRRRPDNRASRQRTEVAVKPPIPPAATEIAAPKRPKGESFGPFQLLTRMRSDPSLELWMAHDTRGPSSNLVIIEKLMSAQRRDRMLFDGRIEAGKRLAHPTVIGHLDDGRIAGVWFAARELVDGIDLLGLRTLVAPDRLPISVIIELIARIAEALDYSSAAPGGPYYCDVNPACILISREGEVKVGGFMPGESTDRAALATLLCELLVGPTDGGGGPANMADFPPKLRGVLIDLSTPTTSLEDIVVTLRRLRDDYRHEVSLENFMDASIVGQLPPVGGAEFEQLARSVGRRTAQRQRSSPSRVSTRAATARDALTAPAARGRSTAGHGTSMSVLLTEIAAESQLTTDPGVAARDPRTAELQTLTHEALEGEDEMLIDVRDHFDEIWSRR